MHQELAAACGGPRKRAGVCKNWMGGAARAAWLKVWSALYKRAAEAQYTIHDLAPRRI
jgi:hypothetical protein